MRSRGARQRGFTLLEVMIALAILAGALTVLVNSVASNVKNTQDAESTTIATSLARAKMYDIEETLIQDGFLETDQSTEGDFGDEGFSEITWAAKVEKVEIPSFDKLQEMQNVTAAGSAMGSGAGSGSDMEEGGFGNSALGGMLSLLGGSTSGEGTEGGQFIQQQFQLVQDVLEASVRKVTLTLKWKVMGYDRDLVVVCYFTDAAGMTKVIGNLGLEPPGGGAGSGSGSGR
jgi:general secretion pathway protein I